MSKILAILILLIVLLSLKPVNTLNMASGRVEILVNDRGLFNASITYKLIGDTNTTDYKLSLEYLGGIYVSRIEAILRDKTLFTIHSINSSRVFDEVSYSEKIITGEYILARYSKTKILRRNILIKYLNLSITTDKATVYNNYQLLSAYLELKYNLTSSNLIVVKKTVDNKYYVNIVVNNTRFSYHNISNDNNLQKLISGSLVRIILNDVVDYNLLIITRNGHYIYEENITSPNLLPKAANTTFSVPAYIDPYMYVEVPIINTSYITYTSSFKILVETTYHGPQLYTNIKILNGQGVGADNVEAIKNIIRNFAEIMDNGIILVKGRNVEFAYNGEISSSIVFTHDNASRLYSVEISVIGGRRGGSSSPGIMYYIYVVLIAILIMLIVYYLYRSLIMTRRSS